MSKKPNRKTIGLFLIIGFTILILVVGQTIFNRRVGQDKNLAVMYFDESVKGLNVGSPVVFNGVEIGKVTQIELIGDPDKMTFSVPVYVKLTPMQETGHNSDQFWRRKTMLDLMIEKGLRAKLLTQSYLTGQLMIELNMTPNTPVNLRRNQRDLDRGIPEIPTLLSPAGELSKGLQDIPVRVSIEKIERILDSLEKQIPIILPAFATASQNLVRATDRLFPQSDKLLNNINKTLYDVSDTARSLRNFADYIERHPEALIQGKKGN